MTKLSTDEQLQIVRELVDNFEALVMNPDTPTGAKEMVKAVLGWQYAWCKTLLRIVNETNREN